MSVEFEKLSCSHRSSVKMARGLLILLFLVTIGGGICYTYDDAVSCGEVSTQECV